MKVSIITINYNGSESTIKLLKSLGSQTDKDFEIIVIDNASEEADFNILKNYCATLGVAQLKLIRNDQNLGFSGGNNAGIKEAFKIWANPVKSPDGDNGASWVLLLNNDTWVEEGFMVSLGAKLSQLSGIVGIPLIEGDKIAYCGQIKWLKPTLLHNYNVRHSVSNIYAIGGAVAIHRDVFEKIGLLDEKYFLYFEDVDFSVRARKSGIPVSIVRGFMIYHKASSTTKKLGAPLLLRYHYRNALYFNLKNGPWYIRLLVWPWSWSIILKQILKIMIYHNREQSVAILKGVFDFYLNKMGKI